MSNAFDVIRPGYEGSSLHPGKGYHDIPLEGVDGPTYRTGTADRVNQITGHITVDGKTGLDIGCSVGGVTFGLADRGATMVGVDYDPTAIETARQVADDHPDLDCTFYVGDVMTAVPYVLHDYTFDFAVWLSQWMWTVKQHGPDAERLLQHVAGQVPTLVFETAQGPRDGAAGAWAPDGTEAVQALLEAHYPQVTDVGLSPGGWYPRNVFVCRR